MKSGKFLKVRVPLGWVEKQFKSRLRCFAVIIIMVIDLRLVVFYFEVSINNTIYIS